MAHVEHILILGGARSGKSSQALKIGEMLMQNSASHAHRSLGLFIATAQARDAEMEERILKHQQERGDAWQTVEEPVDVAEVLRSRGSEYGVVLLDCLTLWVSNLMFSDAEKIHERFKDLCAVLRQVERPVIMVSNEVGLGIVPASKEARRFRDLAGRLHQDVAEVCSHVLFMVAGIPMPVKGGVNIV